MTDRLYTVTELARDVGVTPRTIRFYEDKKLIAPQRAGTTRVYTYRDRARMILILRGKRLGFSLREIAEYLDLYATDVTGTEQLRVLLAAVRSRLRLLEAQLQAVQQTITELTDIERQAVEALAQKPPGRRKAVSAAKTGATP